MNGLVIVNKPKGRTSRDVINDLNHLFNTKKIGHSGTLDPLASGVLVCLIGSYTKLVDLITAYDKEYIATIKLGIKTDTLDITGNVLEQKNFNITKKDIEKVFNSFPKQYLQTVPKYSAIKIKGKKLYEYARNKIDIDLPKKEVNIYLLELIDFKDDLITFKAHVSKGTYIRSLINDICTKLNTIGTMSDLVRIKQGNFSIDNSYTLEQISNNDYQLLNVKDFLYYPVIEIPNTLYKSIINGASIDNTFNIKDYVIFTYQDKDIAIYKKEDNLLKHYITL